MGIEERLRASVTEVLEDLVREGSLDAALARGTSFTVERPKRPEHGDLATNVAMTLAKRAGRNPRDLAVAIGDKLRQSGVVSAAEVAGPGFLNVRITPSAYQDIVGEVLAAGASYGRAPSGMGERVLVEFVSANPTGPLLVSHGRGAVAGDAVARLLEATGHRVTREYYVNDYGNQVRLLAASIRAIAQGNPPPEGGYGGNYVKELAAWMSAHAPELIDAPPTESDDPLARLAVTRMLDGVPGSKELPGIKQTLRDLGVEFDVWFSEESLHRWGKVAAVLEQLRASGWLEEREGALFFKSSEVEDDKDRVVRRSDGRFTYFASDIAYHADKIARGYQRLVNVLGADHHGYVARVRNALEALGLPKERFEVLLVQLVSLLRDGKPYKMGKRLGNLVTVEEVVEEIDTASGRKGAGADAVRYFYLARRSESAIELDIEVAKKRSLDNPVFYLQYGHARLVSILRRAKEVFGLDVPRYQPKLAARLVHPDELALLGQLGTFPRVVREAAGEHAPHRVVFFLQELAQAFQSYYTRLRNEKDAILPQASDLGSGWEARWDREKTEARLLWVEAIRTVYAAGLGLLGISAPDRMVRPDDAAGENTDEARREDDGNDAARAPTKENAP
ncbi:MAG TPA: arginine--tRNA ligase [Polyangiaceae bacterium]|nr:arginine--tRNA ligase [Polyangiaceae bacterium]